MMRRHKPNWWLLYLTVPLMLALLVIDGRIPYSLVVHRFAEFGIVLVAFGLMFLWVHANETALLQEELEKEAWTFEPDPDAEAAMDSALLSFGEDYTSSDDAHRLAVSPTEGRYN